jgi:ElaA protein
MINWQWRTFQELALEELYEVLRLRQDVFILEQKCLYQDIDQLDQQALHLLGLENGKLIVYLRMFPKGTLYPDAISFGRLLIAKMERNKGLAKDAMTLLMAYLNDCNNKDPLIISAQTYLQQF